MRHETQWVYECLLLRVKSRKAYGHLQRRRIFVLPDINTLNRYILKMRGCYGLQRSVFKLMKEKTSHMKAIEERGKLHTC